MPSFTYKAVNKTGQSVSGILTAENYLVALRMLEEQSLYPVKVDEGTQAGKKGFALSLGRRVKPAQLTVFYSQLADLLKAGVPMLRALDVLSGKGTRGPLAQVLKELREEVAGGTSLGDAMAKHPGAFSPLQASMVKAGEQGGFLEDVLHRIAIFSEKQDELRNKVRGAMVYPLILVVFGGGVLVFVLTVVVPKLRPYLRPETFNFMTTVLFSAVDLLTNHYTVILLGVAVVLTAVISWANTEAGRRQYEQFKLKAPIMGNVVTMVSICRFCRILGTMLHNGVPILQALKISKDSAGNKILADVIEESADSVKKGAALSEPLGKSGLFPPTVLDMIAVAEESNNLEQVLVQIADTNEARTARQIDLAVRVLEPLLLLAMAVIVGCIMVGLLLPILTMGSGVK
jgi:general secretion pathway protein F/type IV pilus assembly protein PilC